MLREPAARPREPIGMTGVGPLALVIAAILLAIAIIALPNMTAAPSFDVMSQLEWLPGVG